jgi:hypothetical protein
MCLRAFAVSLSDSSRKDRASWKRQVLYRSAFREQSTQEQRLSAAIGRYLMDELPQDRQRLMIGFVERLAVA